jgi:hypothetical protein
MANQHVPKGDLADNKYIILRRSSVQFRLAAAGSQSWGGACHLWNPSDYPTNPTQNDFGPTLVAPPGFLGAHRSV